MKGNNQRRAACSMSNASRRRLRDAIAKALINQWLENKNILKMFFVDPYINCFISEEKR